MSPSRELVEAVAQELAWDMSDASCKHLTTWWHRREHEYDSGDTGTRRHALRQISTVCHTCPLLERCALLATATRYTGFAAGLAYCNGHPRERARPPAPTQPVAAS